MAARTGDVVPTRQAKSQMAGLTDEVVDQGPESEHAELVLLRSALEGLEDVAVGRVLDEVECERVLAVCAKSWLAENRDALASSNAFVEMKGLPLGRYRNYR